MPMPIGNARPKTFDTPDRQCGIFDRNGYRGRRRPRQLLSIGRVRAAISFTVSAKAKERQRFCRHAARLALVTARELGHSIVRLARAVEVPKKSKRSSWHCHKSSVSIMS
jgi:hypothetical protein